MNPDKLSDNTKKPDGEKPDETRKRESTPTGAGKDARILLNPEEWKEPAGRKVIGEYHKDGLLENVVGSESDLDSFEQYWKAKGKSKMRSEYHKEGAPYVERSQEPDDNMSRAGEIADKTTEKAAENAAERESGKDSGKDDSKDEENSAPDTNKVADSQARQPHIERVIDVATVEVLALAIFRVIFGRGVRVPLKREGFIDMDIVVNDKDVLLNTNEFLFEVPELAVWRFIFAYKGKPVLEYGRGVKHRIKIYYYRMFCLLLAMWWVGRKKRNAQAKARELHTKAEQTKGKV